MEIGRLLAGERVVHGPLCLIAGTRLRRLGQHGRDEKSTKNHWQGAESHGCGLRKQVMMSNFGQRTMYRMRTV